MLSARFAADGQSVIYDAAWEGRRPHLFSTPASSPEPRALDLENAHLLAISRSGEAALGLGGRVASHLIVLGPTLARSPLGGGAPREMLQDVLAADWAPNGTLAVAHERLAGIQDRGQNRRTVSAFHKDLKNETIRKSITL